MSDLDHSRLTSRQQQALDFIQAMLASDGRPPTYREIAEHMGVKSTNGVNDTLKQLERKGYLTRDKMKARGLRPTASRTATSSPTTCPDSDGRRRAVGYLAELEATPLTPQQRELLRRIAGNAGLMEAT